MYGRQISQVSNFTYRPVNPPKMTTVAAPLFCAYPKTVNFHNYDIGHEYSQQISFRNVSSVSRTIRIIPLTSVCFNLSVLKYPANCTSGFIAPGMSVSTNITFVPNSMGDYAEVKCCMVLVYSNGILVENGGEMSSSGNVIGPLIFVVCLYRYYAWKQKGGHLTYPFLLPVKLLTFLFQA